jgi:hypothetical protein
LLFLLEKIVLLKEKRFYQLRRCLGTRGAREEDFLDVRKKVFFIGEAVLVEEESVFS